MSVVAENFFQELMAYSDRIPLEDLCAWITRSSIQFPDVQRYLRFHDLHYVRNLMFKGSAFQALVLCWKNGQRSPIHDHTGSSCAVKVLQGTALETIFDRAPNGMIFPTQTRELPEGSTTGSEDADIHQVSNLQPAGADLVTLHIYSPPLLCMNTYSLLDGSITKFLDPINVDFVEGDGI
ncbi:MAG: cysteine dioxygenase family protein [Bdellovibrionales bacterium]